MVRARLLELNAQHGWRLFGIVSATPKVGKSFIAANIAAALSREPTLRHLCDRSGSAPGIAVGDVRHRARGQPVVLPRRTRPGADAPSAYRLDNEELTILATTARAIRSAELVAGHRAQALLQELRDLGENSHGDRRLAAGVRQ